MPKQVQRKRTKGWRMPENCVSVCRPGKFGNPFTVTTKIGAGKPVGGALGYIAVPTTEDAIECFRLAAVERLEKDPHWLNELRGKDLACFCSLDKPCHVDVLLELANSDE